MTKRKKQTRQDKIKSGETKPTRTTYAMKQDRKFKREDDGQTDSRRH